MNVQLEVVAGDITQQPADALITTVNSDYLGFDDTDASLRGIANGYFHQQLTQRTADGLAVFVPSPRSSQLPFRNVIFVIDDLTLDLSEIVVAGLDQANQRLFSHVTLPLLRCGILEATDQVLEGLARGARLFAAKAKRLQHVERATVERITFVVRDDPKTEHQLRQLLLAT